MTSNNIKYVNNSINISEEQNNTKTNESNFWELITDVAKDLDLALQDLSPDLEISNNIDNGVINENASTDTIRSEEPSNPILFEPIVVRIAGNNSQQNTVQNYSQKPTNNIETSAIDELSIDNSSSETSLPSNEPSLVSQTPSLPLICSSTSICSQIKKSSYCSQLLSVMDCKQLTNYTNANSHNLSTNESEEAINLCNSVQKSAANKSSNDDKNDDNSGASCESIPAVIGLLERLIRCHPIWFLPEIGRAGVVHLLQGKEIGCFIVRQSSKPNTMALSVRLPEGRGPHVEHYLIEDGGNGKLHLEGSDNYFSAIPMLVCHYSNCCDELPVQLTLHKVLTQSSRQQLTSLALLGQDFWQSSLSKLTNSNDINSDNNSSASNSLTRPTPISCSTFKSDIQPPPPVPPKHDVSNLDPIIDTKKSSTVPISVVLSQKAPKIPSRRPDPPPVPPRSKFVSIASTQNANNSSTANPQPLSDTTATTIVSTNENSQQIAPNTEITLIQISDNNCRKLSITSSNSSSSHLTDNTPQEVIKNISNAQKKVVCYRSSLNDKESDYEDIWGANTSSKLTLNSTLEGITETELSLEKCHRNHRNHRNHRSTQTESVPSMKTQTSRQFSSPFYIDPIDAIPNARFSFPKSSAMRRSDTHINETKPSSLFGHSMESLIDNIKSQSSQIDTCRQLFNVADPNLQDASVQVGCSTVYRAKSKDVRESSWPLDHSWQWLDDGISDMCHRNSTLPLRRQLMSDCRRISFVESMKSDVTTVEDLIILQTPELSVPKLSHLANGNAITQSTADEHNNGLAYDNLALFHNNNEKNVKCEQMNDTDTEFSEPWDSDWWEGLLKKVFPRNALMQLTPDNDDNTFVNKDFTNNNCENASTITSLSSSHRTSTYDITEVSSIADLRSATSVSENKDSTASDRLTVLEANEIGIGLNICNYIFKLAAEGNNTFAKAIDHFIQCTKESNENNPIIVMRNIRQFMNGMKNYLVKHGEGELAQMVQQERSKLKPNEFLNIDAILEGTLHKLVIKPLKNFLYQLFINDYNKNGSLKLLSKNIKDAQSKSPEELGVRSELLPLHHKAMVEIQKHLFKLQQSYSPLKKLEHLLTSISTIYSSVRKQQKTRSRNDGNSQLKADYASFGADDFLPIFIYVLIQCGVISAEIEADYMFGLLHPSILSGEGGYYLTTLSSAVHVLKNMHDSNHSETDINTVSTNNDSTHTVLSSIAIPLKINSCSSEISVTSCSSTHSPYTHIKLPSIADLQGYMKIMIPDELTSNIMSKTLPVRPNMTTKEVCKMIAHKFKITNPEDFGLFKLINGEENQLNENDFPQVIKSEFITSGKECQFAYKRCDAKFIWPLSKPQVISSPN